MHKGLKTEPWQCQTHRLWQWFVRNEEHASTSCPEQADGVAVGSNGKVERPACGHDPEGYALVLAPTYDQPCVHHATKSPELPVTRRRYRRSGKTIET